MEKLLNPFDDMCFKIKEQYPMLFNKKNLSYMFMNMNVNVRIVLLFAFVFIPAFAGIKLNESVVVKDINVVIMFVLIYTVTLSLWILLISLLKSREAKSWSEIVNSLSLKDRYELAITLRDFHKSELCQRYISVSDNAGLYLLNHQFFAAKQLLSRDISVQILAVKYIFGDGFSSDIEMAEYFYKHEIKRKVDSDKSKALDKMLEGL